MKMSLLSPLFALFRLLPRKGLWVGVFLIGGLINSFAQPSVDIIGEPAIVNTTTPYTVSIQFSEDVTGFDIGDIVVGNGSASNFSTTDASNYDVDITPDGNGNITIDVPGASAQAISDGQDNTAAITATTIFDNVPPTISIGTPSVPSTSTGPVSYTVSYTGATSVTLAAGDVNLITTGTATGSIAVTGAGTATRTVTISGITGDGTLAISIDAGTATDGVNTAPAAPTSATFTVDNTGPQGFTVNINQDPINSSNEAAISFTFAGAEVGSTYNYSFTSSGGGTPVTNTGTVSSSGQTVSGINLSSLPNGTITLSVTLVDNLGNTGSTDTDTSTKSTCYAGTAAPVRDNTESEALCDLVSKNLNDFTNSPPPLGSVLRWSTDANLSNTGAYLASSIVNASDTYYGFFYDAAHSCQSPALVIALTFNTSPSAGTTTNASRCNLTNAGNTQIDLDDTLTGADPGVWTLTTAPVGSSVTIGNNNVVNFNGEPSGSYVFTYTTNVAIAPCTEDSSTVTITVIDCELPCDAGDTAPVLNTSVPTNFCSEDTLLPLDSYTNSTPPTGSVLTWSINPDPLVIAGHIPGDQIPAGGGTFYGFFYDDFNLCASPILEINIVQNETPVITSIEGDSICGPGVLTLTVTGEIIGSGNTADINWYDAPTGGNLLFTAESGVPYVTDPLDQTTPFWVEASANGCVSSPRQEVIAVVSPILSAGTATNTSACSVQGNGGPVARDLDAFLVGADPGGVWSIVQDPSSSLDINAIITNSNIVNFLGLVDGTYIFRYTTVGAQAPCENDFVDLEITVNDCDIDTDGDGLLDGLEATLGTNPNLADTDADGVDDGVEVGADTANPVDTDGDTVIDALESDILDADSDGVSDQQDPANNNPCIPNATGEFCSVDLEVVKTTDSPQASVGQQVTFTISLNNLSEIEVTGIEVGDLLATGFTYVSHTASAGAYNPDTGAWTVASLAAQTSATLDITVSVQATGDYSNTAELLASSPVDGNPDNDQSTVTIEIVLPTGADLSITKFAQITPGGTLSDVSISPLVDDRIRFVVTVTNLSAEATVSGIQVQEIISPEADTGFEYASHFYNPATLPAGAYNPETGVWNIASLGPGESVQLSIAAFVRREGDFTNTARILSPADADSNNNTASVLVEVNARTPADPGFIFNQFSPNGDGINDQLKIRLGRINTETGLEEAVITSYGIQIFNRYGQSVFEGSNLRNEVIWDGFHKNAEAPSGTYFYVLQYTDEGGAEVTAKGWIQLIR